MTDAPKFADGGSITSGRNLIGDACEWCVPFNHTRQAAEDAAPRVTQAALQAAHLITHRDTPKQ